MPNLTILANGAAVELFAMKRHATRPNLLLDTGRSCRTNDGAIVDHVVAAWRAEGYVVTYDVTDLGDIVQGDRTRAQALPIDGAFGSYAEAVASLSNSNKGR